MECSICLDAITSDTGKVEMSCSHPYHLKCIAKWLTSNTSCPMCRKNASDYEKLDTTFASEYSIDRYRNYNIIHIEPEVTHQPQESELPDESYTPSLQLLFNDAVTDIEPESNEMVFDDWTINIVMDQTRVNNTMAVYWLKRYNGDIVEAIMGILNI